MLEYQPMLQHFQTKQDLSWKRPTEQSVKSSQQCDEIGFSRSSGARGRQSEAAQAKFESISADETEAGRITIRRRHKSRLESRSNRFRADHRRVIGHENRHEEEEPKEQAGKERTRTIRGHRVGSLVRYGIEILRGEHARFVRRRPRPCQVQRVTRRRGREMVGKTRSLYVAQTDGQEISSSQDVCQSDKRCFSSGPGRYEKSGIVQRWLFVHTCIDVFSRYAFAVPSKTCAGLSYRRLSGRYLQIARPTCCRRIADWNSLTRKCRRFSARITFIIITV
jgi:hypothetical protein